MKKKEKKKETNKHSHYLYLSYETTSGQNSEAGGQKE